MARLVTARRSIVGRSVGIGMLALVLLLGALAKPTPIGASRAAEPSETVTIHVFWQSGCPYCSEAKDALAEAYGQDDRVTIRLLEIGRDRYVDELFERALGYFGFNQGGVPLVVIGDRALMGFSSGGRSLDAYAALVARCQRDGCRDVMSDLAGATSSQNASDEPLAGSPDGVVSVPQTISLPLVGVLDTQTLSLPVMTVLLAAIDGFNPCAMWVLVFLVGLLIGLESRRRRWALGGVFLAATAVMYFAVIAAWFNVVTFLGAASWLRYAIGALALWAGFYFLREYWTKPDAACRVTDPGQRQRIMGAFRATVANNNFVLAALGIAVLAVLVNLIELVCSAGVPAVFTQILALNAPSTAQSYAYIALYVFVFMLDDLAIFATAMIALEVTGLTGRYARYSHLVGGVVLIALGALLILRPDLLAFT